METLPFPLSHLVRCDNRQFPFLVSKLELVECSLHYPLFVETQYLFPVD
ncbi:hypothetical protein PDESU_05313 [Pontiella desulfatans]|uniref:Uncharacterized protein n=1 Tax=Pontiella desulfatans TaxID=2750659 RepID=A0A6C2U9D3_PONDE|nr:hypothetical protein PDESU_05313 [Pontiella desulfatans]